MGTARWREWVSLGAAVIGVACLVVGFIQRGSALRGVGVILLAAALVALYRQTDPTRSMGGRPFADPERAVEEGLHLPWRRWRWQLRGLYSALFFALCVSLIFLSWEIAWLITLGLGVHELGHVLAAWRLGIESEMGFGLMGAWTRTPARVRESLGHYANSLIHLAGPVASLAFALLALGLHTLLYQGSAHSPWLGQASFSSLLAVLNLLPMGNLSDGGKFVKRLFASAEEQFEQRLLAMVGVLPVVFVLVVFAIRLDVTRILALLVIVLWFAVSVLLESRQDDPADAASPKAMTRKQARELLSGVLLMLLLGIGVVVLTPFWLTRAHVEGMADGLTTTLVYLIWDSPVALKVLLGLAGLLGASLVGRLVVQHRQRVRNTKRRQG